MALPKFDYCEPATLADAITLLAEDGDDARVMAGGTSLVLMLRLRVLAPSRLISLATIPGLDQITYDDQGLHIGALATHHAIQASPLVRAKYPLIAETFRQIATPRIRHTATIGGNLCYADPNQDPAGTLLALDSQVKLVGPGGERLVSLGDFFVDYYETARQPDEILVEVLVPPPPPRSAGTYLKFLPRSADDWATVGVAALVSTDESGRVCREVRIGLNAAGPVPLRARAAEALLRGQELNPELIKEAGKLATDEVSPIADARGSADYKRAMVGVFVERALTAVGSEQ